MFGKLWRQLHGAKWVCALGVLNGCAAQTSASHVPVVTASAKPSQAPNTERQIREVIEHVVAVRGLAEKEPIRVFLSEPAAYRRALRGYAERLLHDSNDDDKVDLDQAASELAKILLGFYDWEARAIYVNLRPPGWAKTTDPWTTLAHEVTHALQDQHFELSKLLKRSSAEERISVKALIEGDAELVALGVEARKQGRSAKRAMRRAFADFDRLPDSVLLRAGGASPDLLRMSQFTRAQILFQYLDGGAFTAALYRSGGFDLINRVYALPPITTQQVLHPEKYLAGVLPPEIGTPHPPAALKVISHAAFGELFTRQLLQNYVSQEQAFELAAQWVSGSVIDVAATPSSITGWLSIWRSVEVAKQVERLLRRNKDGSFNFVQRSGSKLIVFERDKRKVGARLGRLWFKQVKVAKPQVPPLGETQLRPIEVPLVERVSSTGKLEKELYSSEFFGLRARVPAGWEASVGRDQVQLLIQGGKARGGFVFIEEGITEKESEGVHRVAMESFRNGAGLSDGARLESIKPVQLAIGEGSQWTWRIGGDGVLFRSTLVSTCKGLGAWMFFETWAEPEEEQKLKGWKKSFEPLSRANSVLCRELELAEQADS